MRRNKMTQKELLYMEDAIGHEQNLVSLLQDFSNNVQDKNLASFLKKIAKKHTVMEKKLMEIMEGIENE